MKSFEIKTNPGTVALKDIPVLDYVEFSEQTLRIMKKPDVHCIQYFVQKSKAKFRFFMLIADDNTHSIHIYSHEQETEIKKLESLAAHCYPLHIFEREIFENYGIEFINHPWLKPLRYPNDRSDAQKKISNYPFYKIDSEELHEVGVGPIHAGVIEPGHFRFLCNGEKVLHLEIQLGYQHRGIENLMLRRKHLLQQSVLAESIAGDTAVGHGLAFAQLIEALARKENIPVKLQIERTIALEMERMAVHIGDTAALCGDVAYQLGQAGCEALRTLVINSTQDWCGNRFAKGLIRPGGTNYPLAAGTIDSFSARLEDVHKRFMELADCIYTSPGILSRFEKIGKISNRQAGLAGAVGMAARMAGMHRDIRTSHPFQYFRTMSYDPVVLESGDVFSRGMLRKHEVDLSYGVIQKLFKIHRELDESKLSGPGYDLKSESESLGISLTEGWRGEICHVCITGQDGNIELYKIKDPSEHNWLVLALAVREQEISDFPVCNKSFNLSYCGHDL
jgi:Ni,Fe-hydrogenase III large subunit/NADH:ubiquinone oxidoreductase subunit C